MTYINMDESAKPTPIIVDPKAGPEQPYHFYLTCPYGFAKGKTMESASRKLIDSIIGRGFVMRRKKMGQPIPVWTALVHLPYSYQYKISCYKPCVMGVEWVGQDEANSLLEMLEEAEAESAPE